MMFGFHWAELLVVLMLAVVVFGPRRLPELGGALGKGLRDFRHSLHDSKEEISLTQMQDEVRDVRETMQSLPHEVAAGTRPADTTGAQAGTGPGSAS